ncbi:Protein phosphatase 1 regulatory subunit 3B [Madurella mycetomatis]|uniref:Protein phosphatase 1 regulatory subunit 3B n=1 Tax=Madurella mycetomatis TaxID=100816 RepID=A0A175W3C6_9PEZI|nr:Protein phosphatase 1 regulatory subunit 3B [Madurella mycetomatis]
MPYTPPSHRSPASSVPTSPEGSRRPSFHQQNAGSRPVLPHSSSYLNRHRRTPSAVTAAQRGRNEPSPEATSEDLKGMAGHSVRQSPPPITGDRAMPNGAIISPPDSSSDDDDTHEARGQTRGRRIENLRELHDAISQIPQQRPRLPSNDDAGREGAPDAGDLLVLAKQTEGIHHSLSTGSLDELAGGRHRRFAHTRSATEPHLSIPRSSSSSATGSDEEWDEERSYKPQMVRKKSGELVRPALRPPSSLRRRPSSMPGTPTFSKAVHFDSQIEEVRHFLQLDKPLAVSAGSSPIENYDSETEYPFSGDERTAIKSLPFEWELIMPNFPLETPVRKAQPVRLERIWLSTDQKCLIGSIAVANLAFQKHVSCRFTLDYWKTTSEVVAEYICEIRPVDTPHGQDRFNFTIKLSDLANLESKTLYFCIRYDVNGQEHWDNNGGTNFQVDFNKKILPANGKAGVSNSRPGLPRAKSNRRPSPASGTKQATATSDAFGESPRLHFGQSIHEYLGEPGPTGVRLKGVKSSSSLPSDNLSKRLSAPSGQFANRYDISASISAAIQTARDGLYMKPPKRSGATAPSNARSADKQAPSTALAKHEPLVTGGNTEQLPAAKGDAAATVDWVPATVGPKTRPAADSPTSSISSASYEEIFGSKPSSVQDVHHRGLPPKVGQSFGADPTSDSTNSSNTVSYEGSPVRMGNYYHSHSGIQHHSLHPNDPNPYFQHFPTFKTMGASPVESPLDHFSPQQAGSPLTGQSQSPNSSQAVSHSSPPHSLAGNFAQLAGTSSNEYPYQHLHDRFPFSSTETYASAAIRG